MPRCLGLVVLALCASLHLAAQDAQDAKGAQDAKDVQNVQDASEIRKPSQADLVVGTRVPKALEWKTPTKEERLRVYFRGLVLSPGAYIRSTVTASLNHASNTPAEYKQGTSGFAKRYGNVFLTYSLQDTATQGMAALAGYEMRYIQCKCTSIKGRIGHALKWNFVTYDRNGKQVFNWPSILGGYAIGILSTKYTPEQKWSAQGIQAGNNAIYFGFASSLLQEFLPSRIIPQRKPKATAQTPAVTNKSSAKEPAK